MKTTFFQKVALLSTTTLLFACSEIDNLDLDNELANKQEVSNPVDEETFVSLGKATEIADLFFGKLTGGNVSTRSGESGDASVETLSENGNPMMYIINYPEGGFVIMGSTTNYYPVLAYSDKNSFDTTSINNGVFGWLEETKEAIKTSNALDDTIRSAMQNLWKTYATADVVPSPPEAQNAQLRSTSYSGEAETACWNRCVELQMQYGSEGWHFAPLDQTRYVFENAGFYGVYEDICFGADFNHSPLYCSVFGWKNVYTSQQIGPLLTTQWHQNYPYNSMCPPGKAAGCAAIAIGQIMAYHCYPNMAGINWNNIESSAPYLIKDIGDRVNMHYWDIGSWALPCDVADCLQSYGYTVERANHNYSRVETEIFNNQRPVLMVGGKNNLLVDLLSLVDGHYWVCDGAHRILSNQLLYYTEWQPYGNGVLTPGWYSMTFPGVLGGIGYLYFHMNWGWGASNNNGWFAFNDVNSGNGNYQYARDNWYISK
jgi:hypothetical protein